MQVIIKTTEACNGTCVYCSSNSTINKKLSFPKEQLENFFLSFIPWLKKNPERKLGFTWHGGEPLIRGREFYREVIRLQAKLFIGNLHRINNDIQSNLSLISEAWLPILKKLNGNSSIGTSIDIVPGIRGLVTGENLLEKWQYATKLLKRNNMPFSAIYVVHRKSIGNINRIYYYFRNMYKGLSVRFNPLYRAGRIAENENKSDYEINAEEYGEVLIELAELWLNDMMQVPILPLAEWYHAWIGDFGSLCCDSAGICHKTHIGIAPDGDVFQCGRFSDSMDLQLGNIFQNNMDEIFSHEFKVQLSRRQDNLLNGECKDCKYWLLCHGGCPNISWIYYKDLNKKSFFCHSRLMLFEYFEKIFGPPQYF
jgi:uncharacterized protein